MVALVWPSRSRSLVIACAAVSGAFAVLGAIGLYKDVWLLATLGRSFTPIAPTAAYSFILLALAVLTYSAYPRFRWTRWSVVVVCVLLIVVHTTLLLQYVFGFDLGFEKYALPASQRSREVDFRMAPISAFSFLLMEISTLMLLLWRGSRAVRNSAASLTVVTVLIALVVIVGYGYGTPLLYGGNSQLPMALVAAISFLFLGIAVLGLAGPESWVAQQFEGPSVRAILRRTFLPLVLAILVAQGWMGFFFVSRYRTNPALSMALFTVFSLLLVGIIISFLASRIGGQIDAKEAERREAEKALRESEEKFRTLFEATDDAILLMENGLIQDCNGSSLRLFGCSTEEQIIGQDAGSFSPPVQPNGRVSADEVARLVSAALAGTPQSFEWEHLRCDGTSFSADLRLHAVELRGRAMVQVIVRDITQRKRAEQEKRAFYRDTILNATDGKLRISDDVDVRAYIDAATMKVELASASEVGATRRAVEQFLSVRGLVDSRLHDLISAVGEAMANVVKHAGSGQVYAGGDQRSVWVAISDQGPGIESLILPKAVLKRGFSTKPSMGLGYSIMLEMSDKILLRTGSGGTDLVLVKQLHDAAESTLDELLDTWGGVTSW